MELFSTYLLTGATGFLGNTIAWTLHRKKKKCVALVLKGDNYIAKLPPSTKIIYGDVENLDSLKDFFNERDDNTCLIHCAALVSIASQKNPKIFDINVRGTKNILSLALIKDIRKTIYVSSIHAIPVKQKGKVMTEINYFHEELVKGEYAKSKALATNIAIEYARLGLNVSVVHPSGMIGPGDWRCGDITNLIMTYLKGNLPFASSGKNNFVDARDVTNGILDCADHGRAGECYLMTGHQAKIKDILEQVREMVKGKKIIYLPLWLTKIIAPFYERKMIKKKKKSFLTPYSAYALGVNSNYSSDKAKIEFNYYSRPIKLSIKDTIHWLKTFQSE